MPIRGLRNTITWWRLSGTTISGGLAFLSPVAVQARWEDSHELLQTTEALAIGAKAVIFVPIDMVIGDYLYNGVRDDLDPAAIERGQNGPYEIKMFDRIPDLRNACNERRAYVV